MNTLSKRKNITLAVILVLTLLISLTAGAVTADALSAPSASGKVSVASGAVLRKTASNSGKKIIVVKNNTQVTISSEVFTTRNSTAAKYRWYYVKVNGKAGYIRSDQVRSISYSTVLGKTTGNVNTRKGAGSSMPKKGTIKRGKVVNVVLAAKAKGTGTTWYKIKSGSGYYYLSSKYVKLTRPAVPKKFTVKNLRYPTSLVQGKAFSIRGKIACDIDIGKGVVRVCNSAGKQVIRAEATVNAKEFNINKVDNNVKFGKLAAGSYKYYVDVVVNGKTYTKVNKSFKVTKPEPKEEPAAKTTPSADTTAAAKPAASSADQSDEPEKEVETAEPQTVTSGSVTFKTSEFRYPGTLYEGAAFTIKGKISCSTNMSKVVVQALNSSGKQVLVTEAKVNGKTFDILTVDKNVKFGTLDTGTYTYRVDAYVNGKAYNQLSKKFTIKKSAKAERITNKAFDIAWPAGTSSSKYKYNGGSPTAAYRYALETAYPNRGSWGAPPRAGASCDVFVGTVLRSCGVDPSAPRGLAEQFPYFASSSKYRRISYNGDRSVLRSGDIVLYKVKGSNGAHVFIYLKKNGKEYIAEANYSSTYGVIQSSSSALNVRLRTSDKVMSGDYKMSVYRIKE